MPPQIILEGNNHTRCRCLHRLFRSVFCLLGTLPPRNIDHDQVTSTITVTNLRLVVFVNVSIQELISAIFFFHPRSEHQEGNNHTRCSATQHDVTDWLQLEVACSDRNSRWYDDFNSLLLNFFRFPVIVWIQFLDVLRHFQQSIIRVCRKSWRWGGVRI